MTVLFSHWWWCIYLKDQIPRDCDGSKQGQARQKASRMMCHWCTQGCLLVAGTGVLLCTTVHNVSWLVVQVQESVYKPETSNSVCIVINICVDTLSYLSCLESRELASPGLYVSHQLIGFLSLYSSSLSSSNRSPAVSSTMKQRL